jgi:signal transduction histidine kinase
MVANLLEYAKIDAGVHEKIEKEPTNIRELFGKIIRLNNSVASVEGITLNLAISDNLPEYLLCDGLRITQVLNNLLSNALKFTTPNRAIFITVDRSNSIWSLKVQDSGEGISHEKLNAIFDPYVTDRNAKNNPEGIGLGLYITKHIVEDLFNGTISAFNSPPLGATFVISLPLLHVADPR